MPTRRAHDQVEALAEVASARAQRDITVPTFEPATVLTYEGPRQASVRADSDDSPAGTEPTWAESWIGPLVAGERVLIQWTPPAGCVVVARVELQVRQVTAFTNGWGAAAGLGLRPGVRYWKDAAGMVHFEGGVEGGTVGDPAFTVRTGYRPSGLVICSVVSNGVFGRLDAQPDGEITPMSPSNNTYVMLDNLHYRAEA